jgi:hypothetical protein
MRIEQPALFDAQPLTPYRYTLRRLRGPGPSCCWIMLNPSTATEHDDDPTIRRCIRFSVAWGYGRLVVVHLFALRSTNPAALAKHADPIGADNDQALVTAARQASAVVCAWGAHPSAVARARAVASLLRGVDLHCLGTTKHGQPRHPLYVKRGAAMVPFQPLELTR